MRGEPVKSSILNRGEIDVWVDLYSIPQTRKMRTMLRERIEPVMWLLRSDIWERAGDRNRKEKRADKILVLRGIAAMIVAGILVYGMYRYLFG